MEVTPPLMAHRLPVAVAVVSEETEIAVAQVEAVASSLEITEGVDGQTIVEVAETLVDTVHLKVTPVQEPVVNSGVEAETVDNYQSVIELG